MKDIGLLLAGIGVVLIITTYTKTTGQVLSAIVNGPQGSAPTVGTATTTPSTVSSGAFAGATSSVSATPTK